jgi:hypothetical protein
VIRFTSGVPGSLVGDWSDRARKVQMHAEDIVEEFPVVSVDSNALDAARMIA